MVRTSNDGAKAPRSAKKWRAKKPDLGHLSDERASVRIDKFNLDI
jgi:hypothetical protein